MRRYNDNDNAVLKAMEVGNSQLIEQIKDKLDYEKAVCFMHYDITIVNPFRDDTGRKRLTLNEAYSFYGEDVVNKFIEECNIDEKEEKQPMKWFEIEKFMAYMRENFPEPMSNHFTYNLLEKTVKFLMNLYEDNTYLAYAISEIVPEITEEEVLQFCAEHKYKEGK